MSFISGGSARFNWHSFKVTSLEVPPLIVYDVAMKVLDTIISSAQHRWPNLWHYIYCFIQSGEAFAVEGNKYTRARTQTGFYSTFFKVKSLVVSFKRGCFLAKFWFFLKTVYIIFYLTFTESFFVFQHIWVAKIVLKSSNLENWWNLREKNVENRWNLREKNVENGGLEVMGREA